MGYKITELTALNATPAGNDIIPVVDVSDTTQASSGSTKKMTVGELANAIGTGDTGVKGDTGSQGIQGVKGDTGIKGDTGNQGIKGDTGTFLAKGDTGDKGDTGTKGDTGVGGISFIYNEVPSGTVNGSNKAFDTANNYVAGTIQVFRDGQLMKGGGEDYTETDSNTVTFTTAPVTGSVLLVSYQKITSTNGNADTVDGYHANATPTANNVPVLDSNAKMPISTVNPIHPINAPEGFLINGKIVPSVASNNLTVALKTLAGTDPSATDPIYVRIGGVVRTITSALSLTANAGTNYLNLGSSEIATKETDLFVSLCWNTAGATPVILLTRVTREIFGDYVNNNTAEKGRITGGTTTGIDSFDTSVVIGRIAATLSAGASYNWSVPTFDSRNLIQRPIYETRWLAWTPTNFYATASMTWTSITTFVANYRIESQRIEILLLAVGTVGGTPSYGLQVVPPMAPTTIETVSSMPVKDGGGSEAGAVEWESSNSTLQIRKYNQGTWGAGANRGFWGLTWYRV